MFPLSYIWKLLVVPGEKGFGELEGFGGLKLLRGVKWLRGGVPRKGSFFIFGGLEIPDFWDSAPRED